MPKDTRAIGDERNNNSLDVDMPADELRNAKAPVVERLDFRDRQGRLGHALVPQGGLQGEGPMSGSCLCCASSSIVAASAV